METKKTFSKLNAIFNNVDGSKQNQNIFIKFPDYAWPKYFGAYMELLLTSEILTKRKLTTSLVLNNRAQGYVLK